MDPNGEQPEIAVGGAGFQQEQPLDELKRKRTVQKLTNGDRKWICQRKLAYPSERIGEMQDAFRLERNPDVSLKSGTVSGIIKQSDKWLSINDEQETGTRTRSSKEPELEAALYAWRTEQLNSGEKVRDEDLRDKARELAAAMGINTDRSERGLSFSSGWLDRFKKRNAIKQSRYNRRPRKNSDLMSNPMASVNLHVTSHLQQFSMQHMIPSSLPFPSDIPAVPHTAPVAQERIAHINAIPEPEEPPTSLTQAQQPAVMPPPFSPRASQSALPSAHGRSHGDAAATTTSGPGSLDQPSQAAARISAIAATLPSMPAAAIPAPPDSLAEAPEAGIVAAARPAAWQLYPPGLPGYLLPAEAQTALDQAAIPPPPKQEDADADQKVDVKLCVPPPCTELWQKPADVVLK
jgi:hypothetical protein